MHEKKLTVVKEEIEKLDREGPKKLDELRKKLSDIKSNTQDLMDDRSELEVDLMQLKMLVGQKD